MREWAEQLVARARAEGVELTGDDGLLTAMIRQVLQTGLEVELSDHLGYELHDPAGRGSGNSRNGMSRKRVTTDVGDVELAVPRDRNGTFDPQSARPHARQPTVHPACRARMPHGVRV
jgi:transposase-like protein